MPLGNTVCDTVRMQTYSIDLPDHLFGQPRRKLTRALKASGCLDASHGDSKDGMVGWRARRLFLVDGRPDTRSSREVQGNTKRAKSGRCVARK